MGRRVNRVQYHLDSKGLKTLPEEEIRAILRGADDLIMTGGRTLLAKILKGSKEKKVLEYKLNESPVYGYFKDLTIDDIIAKVDWCIQNNYLDLQYEYRLPLVVYTEKGWEIEKDIYTDELLQKISQISFSKEYEFVNQLKDKNRQMIWLLLDKIQATGSRQYIPILEQWARIDYKKVSERIRKIIEELKNGSKD